LDIAKEFIIGLRYIFYRAIILFAVIGKTRNARNKDVFPGGAFIGLQRITRAAVYLIVQMPI
jgi:hypothetical protein